MPTLDDRGREVTLQEDPEGIHKPIDMRLRSRASINRDLSDPRTRSVMYRRGIATSIQPQRSRARRLYDRGWALLTLVTWAALLAGVPSLNSTRARLLSTLSVVCVLVLVLLLVRFLVPILMRPIRKKQQEKMRRELKALPAFCAGCWYPLGDRVEPDGCTVCPECGAAWRIASDQPGSRD